MEQREILKLLVKSALDKRLTPMQVARIVDKVSESVELEELLDRICAESEEV